MKQNPDLVSFVTKIAKLIAISLLPIILFFRRDLDYSVNPELFFLYAVLYGISIIIPTILLLRSFSKIRRSRQKGNFIWFGLSSLILFLSILFGKELSLLNEILTFRAYQDDLSELVELARSAGPETRIENTLVEIPDRYNDITEENHIFVLRDPSNSIRLVSLYSRPNTYITYLPMHKHKPNEPLVFQYGYVVNCFYKLSEYWYICSISR